MAISTKDIRTKIENNLAFASGGNLDPLEVAQNVAALGALKNAKFSVPTLADLPPASENNGRMVFVDAVGDYRYSNGEEWTRNYDTNLVTQEDIWAWGENNFGVLGDGTTVRKSSPVSVIGGFTDWCQVSAGCGHTAAVRTNGTLWAWGYNGFGQLGNDTTVSKSSPVSVVGGFTDWCQVSGGRRMTAALRTNGTLWSWGHNGFGQLGDGTQTSRSSPVSVIGGFTDWCQVSAARDHTAAVRANGTLWTWGGNSQGTLGDGTTVSTSSPVSVVGGFTDWCQVSAGRNHTAAVRTNGTLWAWGNNGFGQLGDGTIVTRTSPVSVVGGFTDWCNVGSGRYHTAAVRTNGTLWTWGYNTQGQLGDNTTSSKRSPVSTSGGAEYVFWKKVGQSSYSSLTIAVATTTKRGFNTP